MSIPIAPLPSSCDCVSQDELDPCIFVIFGASGDLAARKLVPALYRLFLRSSLPRFFAVVGCGRSSLSREAFCKRLRQACAGEGRAEMEQWPRFAESLFYYRLRYDEPSDYQALSRRLGDINRQFGCMGNLLINLALPPSLYPVVAEQLGAAGLGGTAGNEQGWRRLVVEKPFGRDLQSALELDAVLQTHFDEKQIYRIDHYLAKETVQSILMFRFANAIFEPVWNRGYIEHVAIMAAERLGVENRSGYYEQSGVIRDMFQNHMLQLMSLIAMEPPSHFESERVRDEKVKVLRAVRPFRSDEDEVVLGQYAAGVLDGVEVPAYRDEPGVDPGSRVPTFAMMRLFVENWRWQGVPFYLVSGKRLAEKKTRIVVQFREIPHSMFRRVIGEEISANRLIFSIYPDEGISLTFQAKNPGPRVCLRPMSMDFRYPGGSGLDAYEKLLLDCILGDRMLFWRQDGIEQSWKIMTPVLNECESCPGRGMPLHFYDAGGWGPEAAGKWVGHIR